MENARVHRLSGIDVGRLRFGGVLLNVTSYGVTWYIDCSCAEVLSY